MTDAITTELGCPKDWCSANQTSSGAGHIEDFIKRLKEFEFEPGFDKGSTNHIVYEPIGVCGLITPWNWPINQIALKVLNKTLNGININKDIIIFTIKSPMAKLIQGISVL